MRSSNARASGSTVATDAAGYRRVIAAAREADKKGLKVVCGLQRRYQDHYMRAFEEVKSAENVLARVETDSGIVGWGGAGAAPTMTGETVASMAAAIRYLAPRLEGMPLDDIGQVMARAGNYLFGNNSAKSVIEIALSGRAARSWHGTCSAGPWHWTACRA